MYMELFTIIYFKYQSKKRKNECKDKYNNGKYTYVMIIFTQVPANVFAADTYICNKYWWLL